MKRIKRIVARMYFIRGGTWIYRLGEKILFPVRFRKIVSYQNERRQRLAHFDKQTVLRVLTQGGLVIKLPDLIFQFGGKADAMYPIFCLQASNGTAYLRYLSYPRT